ncbi:DNA cytosine methyltransferase [Paenarthrobacter sp. CAP02]|uniref:DNA cytosine methyltransferase n=1 Tax=Paenarthrobacter sp. CAP02 TaxID=3158144 RepID=UPI0032D9E5A2
MIPVVDIFAGPGGLNEGFSSVLDPASNKPVFKTAVSIEMEQSAVNTLTLRAAYRHLLRSDEGLPQAYQDFLDGRTSLTDLHNDSRFASAYKQAQKEVRHFELSENSRADSDKMIEEALGNDPSEWILIGGPPCQAYSLAGRSRRTNDLDFENDHKHFLYREYLHIIKRFKPAIYVMENVKGLLSATNGGSKMFELIRRDLTSPSDNLTYKLHSMVVETDEEEPGPEDFIIRAEDFGIPQKRHRVIIIGVREDLNLGAPAVLEKSAPVTVREAIGNLPKIRSSVSRTADHDGQLWADVRRNIREIARRDTLLETLPAPSNVKLDTLSLAQAVAPSDTVLNNASAKCYHDWIAEHAGSATLQHEARGHMIQDLQRYYLLSALAHSVTDSPKVRQLPRGYWPNHKNVESAAMPFEDRFRVQVWNKPSTTIVSHIAKDGHYYIHPDPSQMRSLTVREAARLQTFPDNYVFVGNRTQQYTQVGNAVPPLLAHKIGKAIADLLLCSTSS